MDETAVTAQPLLRWYYQVLPYVANLSRPRGEVNGYYQ